MGWLTIATDFGDLAVLIPLAGMTLIWLLLTRAPRCAAWWAIVVSVCIGLTALVKISFYACPPTGDLHSPSGHASLSTLIYGAMALMAASDSAGWRRIMAIIGGVAFVLAIAVSRIVLDKHNSSEVGFGLVIGLLSLVAFRPGYLRSRPTRMRLPQFFLAAGVLMLAFNGRELHAEEFLQRISDYFNVRCP